MNYRVHVDRGHEDDLGRLRVQLIMMGGRVEALVGASIRAVTERDVALARRAVDSDCVVDQHEITIDEICRDILTLHQPAASTVRFVTSSLRLAIDLERIADLGVSISRCALDLCAGPSCPMNADLPRMAGQVEGMLHEALSAFVAGDASRAEEVIARDRLVDDLSAQIFRVLFAQVAESARGIRQAVQLQSLVKHVERVGDHVVKLGETVVLMVRGEDLHPAAPAGGSSRAVAEQQGN
ncbi:MAG: phosphate signaling complex protein PhoU [Polyangia bacterium]